MKIAKTILNNSSKLKKCTGLNKTQFDELCQRITPLWNIAERQRLSRPGRKRNIGAGRPYALYTLEEKLFCVLILLRLGFVYWFTGMIVGIDAATVKRLSDRLKPFIKEAADAKLHKRLGYINRSVKRKKISSWEELQEQYPDVAEILIDATEQPIQRPRKQNKRRTKAKQQKHYSGKKKRHTRKSQVTINRNGLILHLSKSIYGKQHDYKLLKRSQVMDRIAKVAKTTTDTGYDGIKKDFANHNITQPIKRRRGSPPLSRKQKAFNKAVGRSRILVEHIIGRMKQYQILTHTYRRNLKNYDLDISTVAALTNFKLLSAQ